MLIALLMMSILPGSIENLVFLASVEATFALETLETLETARDARDRSRPAETLETRRDGPGRSGRLPIGRNAPFRAGTSVSGPYQVCCLRSTGSAQP